MKLTFLGTSSAVPTVERGLSSLAISRGSELILFDAGEGMQRNFIKAGLGMNRKMKIFISHLHADHCVGLLGLMQTMSLQGRTSQLDVYGQIQLKEFITECMRVINFGLSYDLRIHTIEGDGVVAKEADYQITCCTASHSIPSLSFCLEEFDRPGVFDVKRAKEIGLPEGELYGTLQRGEDVHFDGKVVKSSEIVGPSRRGRKVCYSGDTRPSDKLAGFYENCDVLVHESTYGLENQQKAIEHGHSTAEEAALVARKANAINLYLTHFSARYDETAQLVSEARKIHPNTWAAEDLMEFSVPYTV